MENPDLTKRFWTKYKALFGAPPFKDEEKEVAWEWEKVIGKIQFARLDSVFEAVLKERGKARYRPMLEDFRRAIGAIHGRETFARRYEECGLCENRGFVVVLGYTGEGGRRKLGIGGVDCGIWTVPCLCSRGQRYQSDKPGTRERLEKAKAWVVQMQEEARLAETSYEDYIHFQAQEQNVKAAKALAKAQKESA